MPIYIFAGPLVAVIGIVAVFFVMRHKSVQTRSMYSSRRSQIERKVKAARQRTLAPRGRSDKAPTDQEIAAAAPPMGGPPAYEAPMAPLSSQAWDSGPVPAPMTYSPPAAPPPPIATPTGMPVEPGTPTPPDPVWTPAPSEAVWTPESAPYVAPAPAREPAAEPAAAEPVSEPAGDGASWSIVGEASKGTSADEPAKKKGRKKEKQAAEGSWELASGEAPAAEDDDEVKAPTITMAVAQYAVIVVGLVMVLLGVLVMVANTKTG